MGGGLSAVSRRHLWDLSGDAELRGVSYGRGARVRHAERGRGGKRRKEKLPSALKALLAHSVSSSAPERADAVNHEALYVPGGEEGKHRTPAR